MQRAAFVTGGSSGIGLEVARLFARQGRDVALFARDLEKLEAARASLLVSAPNVRVTCHPVNVVDTDALTTALQQAIDLLGIPDRAVASAGIAIPGLFAEQPLSLHHDHMQTNYFGSLTFVHALTEQMATAGGGRIGLVASGAAFFGIHGYSVYAPSKFALRGLAEVLRIELAPAKIGVTLCYPPDTDTPQLASEKKTKPAATRKITKGGGLWQPQDVARILVAAMDKNKFIAAPGLQMKALNLFGSLAAPALRIWQGHILRKSKDDTS